MSGPAATVRRLSAVIDRDLRKFARSPFIMAVSVLMPIIYLVFMGNSLQGKLVSLPLALVVNDSGPHARQLVDNMRALQAGPRTVTLEIVPDEQLALQGIRAGRYKAALIVPSDFSRRVDQRARPDVGLFLDNSDTISSETIRSAVQGAVGALPAEYVSIRESSDIARVRETDLYRNVDYLQSLVPGVVVMTIFIGTLATGVFNSVIDRSNGVAECYLLTPLTKADIVGGLILSGLATTTFISTLVLIVGVALTGIPFPASGGALISLLTIIILTTLCLQGLMFALTGRADNIRIVNLVGGFLNVILFFPSGAIYPIESLPGWLKTFAKINPETYAVDAMKAVLFKNAGLGVVMNDLVFLAVFAAISITVAIFLFRRTL